MKQGKRPILCLKEVDKQILVFDTRGKTAILVSSEKWYMVEQPSGEVHQKQRKHFGCMMQRLKLTNRKVP